MSQALDEYDAYFDDLGEDDLAAIDAICEQYVVNSISSTPRQPPETKKSKEVDGGTTVPVDSEIPSSSSQQKNTQTETASAEAPVSGKPIDRLRTPPESIAVFTDNLLKLFRPRGRLSVTDLVTPSWCEFKFDYSLRGQRWKGAKMDDVIVSKHGKSIQVEKTVVVKAEKIMKQGQEVHKKLEEELPMVEVVVKVKTAEERFALQILNMIANLKMLVTVGTCREFHVMGFINGIYVTGIIDEISRKPLFNGADSPTKRPSPAPPKTPRKKSKQVKEDDKQSKLESYFPLSPSKKRIIDSPDPIQDVRSTALGKRDQAVQTGSDEADSAEEPLPSKDAFTLYLSDTKTRASPTMPSDDLSGRLQLMLYHELLDNILRSRRNAKKLKKTTPASLYLSFSFEEVLEYLNLDSRRAFSPEFVLEASQLLQSSYEQQSKGKQGSLFVQCLDDLIDRWYKTLPELALRPRRSKLSPSSRGPIDDGLELVYRLRGGKSRKPREPKGKGKKKEKAQVIDLDPELQAAIDASLAGAAGYSAASARLTEEQQLQAAIAESIRILVEEELLAAGAMSKGASSSPPAPAPPSAMVPVQSRSSSESPSAGSEREWEVVEQEAEISLSQRSEMDWEAAFGDHFVKDEEILAVDIPSAAKIIASRDAADNEEQGDRPVGASVKPNKSIPSAAKSALDARGTSAGSEPPKKAKSGPRKRKDDVIGVKQFLFDRELLERHMILALEFWEGRREPRGVDIEDTWKCGMCEYRDGCEWREAKAIEAVAQVKLKNNTTR